MNLSIQEDFAAAEYVLNDFQENESTWCKRTHFSLPIYQCFV